MSWSPLLAVGLAVLAGCAAAGPAATGAPSPALTPLNVSAGSDLCALLSATDFAAAGVPGAGVVKKNSEQDSHYCVFAGESGATGGIELDAFIEDDPTERQLSFETLVPTANAEDVTARVVGVDEAWIGTAVSGGPEFAALAVRSGNLVVGLSMPAVGEWRAQLVTLANLIRSRAAALPPG